MKKRVLLAQILECISNENGLYFYEKCNDSKKYEKMDKTFETMLELLNDDEFFKELTDSISHIYIKKVRLN